MATWSVIRGMDVDCQTISALARAVAEISGDRGMPTATDARTLDLAPTDTYRRLQIVRQCSESTVGIDKLGVVQVKVLLVGSGYVGSAVRDALGSHEVVVASRSTDPRVDLLDPTSIRVLYEQVGPIDAVVVTAGAAPFKPVGELTRADFVAGLTGKAVAQIDLVLQGIPHVADTGSFTLTTGIVGRETIRTGAASAAANGAIERFVTSAAAELPRGLRINAISPNVLAEAPGYHPFFPGFIPVPAATVAQAYVRSVEGIQTGRIYEVD